MEPKIKRNFTFQVSEKGGSEWNHTNAGDIYDAYPTEDEIVEYYMDISKYRQLLHM